VRALEAEVGGVIIALRNQVPALGDSLAGLPNLLGGTVGGILDNLLGGGLGKLGS
jgi:outer membrane lipoprotein SlyB